MERRREAKKEMRREGDTYVHGMNLWISFSLILCLLRTYKLGQRRPHFRADILRLAQAAEVCLTSEARLQVEQVAEGC